MNVFNGPFRDYRLAVVKLFSTRRTPDPPQRHQIVESAAVVAEVMLKHVEFNEFGRCSRHVPSFFTQP